MKLNELNINESARILHIAEGEKVLYRHLLDMGFIPGTEVKLIKFAPMGDPLEIRLHGYELTMRVADAADIEVERIEEREKAKVIRKRKKTLHPGLGEGGKYHDKKNEHPLPEETKLRFALVGNQNCGKTTLFNQLTGSNQHVGNFPGVTVDSKSGMIKGHANTEVVDLPGIYSLAPYSQEEIVSRRFILEEKPTAIINIIDATNIERNLYLTMQLLELDIPMVVALNMMDEVRNNNGSIDVNELEQLLGVPVVAISAAKNEGISELAEHAIHIARYQEKPKRQDFCDEKDHNGALHRCLHGIMYLIVDHAASIGMPLRFAATKIIEGDEEVMKALKFETNEAEMLEHIIVQMEQETTLERCAAIADMRYSFIVKICERTVVKPQKSKEYERSEKIDRILCGRYTAIPAFIAIMCAIFYLTFNCIGLFFQNLLQDVIDVFTMRADVWLSEIHVNQALHSLLIDGVFKGVGSVLSFIPIVVILFFFLSLLEDSGYMARAAFVMDKLLRKIGLSGRSIVPMLIGFGCTVPAVMAARTLPSERDRKMTIMLTPFLSCSAKLPVYGFVANACFPQYAGYIMIGMYLFGIICAVLFSIFTRKTLFKANASPFVMELPNYRMPSVKTTLQLMWDKAKDFLEKAFTIIFLATVIIWLLQSFDFSMNMVSDPSKSMLAIIAGYIAFVFRPIGLSDWRIVTALITGFIAKESVVSTISVLFGGTKAFATAVSGLSALALLIFTLLYTPCVAAIAAIRRELGMHWACSVMVFQCVLAWCVSYLVYLAGSLF